MLKGLGALLGAAAFAKAMAPLTEWAPHISAEEFLQKHYNELTPIDLQIILSRLETHTREHYGADVSIRDSDILTSCGSTEAGVERK